MHDFRYPALLLLGPTGAGKTPLGNLLQARGLAGRRCLHFDFGASLRQLVERDRPDALVSREDLDFLKQVLQTGALLEDERFSLAERVLRTFLAENRADQQTLVVLNGLPRHVGQAEALDAIVEVQAVVSLRCSA
jgi:adenylate kinase family enzyme